jgi:hypothetical protein
MSSFFSRRRQYETLQDIKPLNVEEILGLKPSDVKTTPILNDANFKEHLTGKQQKAFRTFAAYKRTSIPITKTTIRNYIKEDKQVDEIVFDAQIEDLNRKTFERRVLDLTRDSKARGTKKRRKITKNKKGKRTRARY